MVNRQQHGFTLIEVIITIVILGIVAGLGATLLQEGFKGFFASKDRSAVTQQGRIAEERMRREIASAKKPNQLVITPSTQITFRMGIGNNTVQYSLSSGDLLRQESSNTPQLLAQNVSSLNFNYLDSAGNVTAVLKDIRFIQFSFTVTEGQFSKEFSRTVYAKNL